MCLLTHVAGIAFGAVLTHTLAPCSAMPCMLCRAMHDCTLTRAAFMCPQVLQVQHLRETEPELYSRLEAAVAQAQAGAPGLGQPPMDPAPLHLYPPSGTAPSSALPSPPAVRPGVGQAGVQPPEALPAASGAGSTAAPSPDAAGAAAAAPTLSANKSMEEGSSIMDELEASLLAPAQQNPPKQPTLTSTVNIAALETAQVTACWACIAST